MYLVFIMIKSIDTLFIQTWSKVSWTSTL